MINGRKKNDMKLKTNLYKSVEVGPYRFNFHRDEKNIRKGSANGTYLKISARGRDEQWSLTIPGNAHVYGYLTAALEQGKNDQLHGYAFILNAVSMLLTQDENFNADIQKAIMSWQERMNEKAKVAAENVTDSEEMASQAFMESVVERSQMSKKEAKAASEAEKAEMRAILNEDKEGE